jgi:perosamine synthetase
MDFIPVNQPLLDGNEKAYVLQCLDSGWISSEGEFVKRFEHEFARSVGRKYGIAVCNGSVALDVAIAALGIGIDDEVILPTFTIISCAAAIVRSGAIPVVVDCDRLTWNMDVNQIEAKITPRTKAIMVVHIYGLPVDMNPILDLAKGYNLQIIEDAAEMHGQTYNGKPCGSFGTISTFSFYANKHITTGEGGMLVTDDLELSDRCMSLRNLCFDNKNRFVHEDLGWNYRMTNLQAALGVAQLERLEAIVSRKRAMGKLYTELLKDIPGLQLPIAQTSYAQNIYWVYGIVLEDSIPFDAKELMKQLGEYGIGTRPFFFPMHLQPVFKRMGLFFASSNSADSCPIAENISQRGFYIPSGTALTENQIVKVAETIIKLINA